MKKFIYLFILLLFIACQSEVQNPYVVSDDLKIPEDLSGIRYGNFVFPEGTKSSVTDNLKTLNFYLPEGYLIAGLDEEGNVNTYTEGCYQCSSTNCVKGCDVVNLAGNIGCSSCTDPTSASCTGKPCDNQQSIGGSWLIPLHKGISLKDEDDLSAEESAIAPLDVLLSIQEIDAALDAFFLSYWKTDLPDEDNYTLRKVDFFGKIVVLKLPKNEIGRINAIEDVSCNCSQGEGCTLEEIRKTGVTIGHTCESNGCSTCQMYYDDPQQ